MIALSCIVGGTVVLVALVLGGLALFTAWTARRAEEAVPPLGRFVEVDGARIHYLDEGSGPALLLIHGLGGQMRHFTHSLLDRLKNDYRVVIIDRPGSGYSTRPPDASAAISAQARTIAQFAAAIGLQRPLVVGHSLGGAIALSFALGHPEQVAGLALLAPLTHPQKEPSPVFRRLAIRSRLLRRVLAWTLATPLSISNRKTVLDTVFGPQNVPRDFATGGGALLGLRPSAFINASCDLMAIDADLEAMPPRYQRLTVPVGILFGTDDRILDASAHGKALAARVSGADFEFIEGGGHMIPICSADRCAAFIARMTKRAAAAPSIAKFANEGAAK